jgi:NAD-dependent SIR2 family protein deacetylase
MVVEVYCAKCGGTATRKPQKVKTNKNQIFFCCRECEDEWIKEHGAWNKGKTLSRGHRSTKSNGTIWN